MQTDNSFLFPIPVTDFNETYNTHVELTGQQRGVVGLTIRTLLFTH